MAETMRKLKKEKEYCLYTSGVVWKNKVDKQYVYFKDDGCYYITSDNVRDIILEDIKTCSNKALRKRHRINTKKYSLVYIGYMTYKEFKKMKTEEFEKMLNDSNNYLYELI